METSFWVFSDKLRRCAEKAVSFQPSPKSRTFPKGGKRRTGIQSLNRELQRVAELHRPRQIADFPRLSY
jgi:hypothetical protein